MRDLFEHSWRLVVANLAWGLTLLVILSALTLSPGGLLLLPLLAIPTSGVYRVAALIARGERVGVADSLTVWWRFTGRSLALGVPIASVAIVLGTNVIIGLGTGEVVGFALAIVATWGLVALAVSCVVLWPIVVDPWRDELPSRDLIRLGLLMALAFPWRFLVVAVVLGVVFILTSLAVVTFLSLALGFVALIACRYVLPAADRFSPPPDRASARS